MRRDTTLVRSLVVAIAGVVMLGGCGKSPKSPQAAPTSDVSFARGADPVVMAERRASGRWRSEPGVLPGDPKLWVIIDIAGDRSLRIERRGMSSRYEAVYGMASGRIAVTPEGYSAEAPDADGSLRPFRSFTATFPSPAKMMVTAGDRTFVFRYAEI